MNKAVIIIPYYGKLPSYFGFYLKSLENKNIDVLWISDLSIGEHPSNFKILQMPFEELHQLFEEKLSTKVVINGFRRFCDMKPMYGKVFIDYIKDYEYWGHGDCDLVYGDKFNDFIKRTIDVGCYDVISMRKDYLSGPTCFYRNNDLCCNLFTCAENWREICAFDGPGGVLIFDECGGEFHNQLVSGEMTLEECARHRDNMSSVVWRTPNLKVYHADDIIESPLACGEIIEMDVGRLTMDDKEIAVFHYVLAKIPRYFRYVNVPYAEVKSYRIDRTGFYVGDFAWTTRGVRRVWRVLHAGWESFRQHGLRHVFNRIGL